MEGETRRPKEKITFRRRGLAGISILYEDPDILVIDKPAGLLTIATARERERTAYRVLTEYVRKGNPKSRKRVYIVHRLDRETSGVLVFAKTEEAKQRLQGRWEQTEKRYLAVVHGRMRERTGRITSYLAENRAHAVYSTSEVGKGRLSQTDFAVVRETESLTALEVRLLTGRKHQIRVHLADRGHPVVGDDRYGRRDGGRGGLALHARSISFDHPTSGHRLTFTATIPSLFLQLVGSLDIAPHPFRTPDAEGGGEERGDPRSAPGDQALRLGPETASRPRGAPGHPGGKGDRRRSDRPRLPAPSRS